MEREAAEGAADVLLAVPPDELGDLMTETSADHRVALGIVGQEIDRGELDGLEEGAGLRRAGAARARLEPPGIAGCRLDQRIGKPDLLGLDPQPPGQPVAGNSPATTAGEQARRSSGIACRL